MAEPCPQPGAVRRHRRTSHAVRIGTGLFCAAAIGGVGVTLHERPTGLTDVSTQATLGERTERASRGGARSPSASRSPSPTPVTASPAPAVSAPAGQLVPRAKSPAATRATTRTTTAAPEPEVPAGCESYSGNRRIACSLLPSFGFGLSQMPPLDRLWEQESGWNHRAENPYSGAYGIPQALPGEKMATAGSDWATNPATQIKWGLGYIKERYGTPAGAWAFWQANNWY